MSSDADRLPEFDLTDPSLDAPPPAKPVVVIPYRTKSPPWLLIIAFMVVSSVVPIAIYHIVVARRYRDREARLEFEIWKAQQKEKAGSVPAVETSLPTPLAMNTQPVVGSSGDPPPSGVLPPALPASGTPAPASTPARAPVPAPAAPPTQGAPAAVPPATPRVPDTKTLLTEAGLLDRPATAKASAPPRSAPPATPSPPAFVDGYASYPPLASTRPEAPAATPAPAEDQATAERAPAESEPAPSPAADSPEPAPLPSKEETMRAIQEEAAKKQQEIDLEQRTRDTQVLALQEEERRKFLEELSEILRLRLPDNQAGPQIEKLSQRSGRSEDPLKRARAYGVLYSTRYTQAYKVRRLREIGMPEAVILDYLANDLHHQLGTRNGPRDRNGVWVRAAQLLLKYDRVVAGQAPGPARPASRAAAANRPAGSPTPRGAAGAR